MKKFRGKLRNILKEFRKVFLVGVPIVGTSRFEVEIQRKETPKVKPNVIKQERKYNNSKKIEGNENNLHLGKKSDFVVNIPNSYNLICERKPISKEYLEEKGEIDALIKEIQAKKAEWEKLCSDSNEPISSEEITALQETGNLILVKGNEVDAAFTGPNYPARPSGSSSGKIPKSGDSKPPRLPSGFGRTPGPRTPPRIIGSQDNNGLGGNGGNGKRMF